eukprot:GGOE01032083.1.p1 GENE.GGOE01032083.1~~GGOE01032083.1.p1  ORF type:complete len:1174 (-),score=330.62 GGOE01032083.1:861-4049(-)
MASGVVPVFNLAGPTSLILSTTVLARIFRSNITTWDDPAIQVLNPGFSSWRIPTGQPIEVVVYGVPVGLTQIMKQSLSSFDPTFARQVGLGAEPLWPNVTVTFQNDSRRMLSYIMATAFTIGYVVLDDAVMSQLPQVKLLKGNAALVEATQASVEYAVLELGSDFGNNGDDPAHLTADIHNAPGQHSWPIVGYSYLMMRTQTLRRGATCENVRAVVHFWNWFWTAEIIPQLLAQHSVSPLPSVVISRVLSRFRDDIQCNGIQVWESMDIPPISGMGPTLVTGLFRTMVNIYAIVEPDSPMQFTSDEATWELDINQQLKSYTFVATTDRPSPSVDDGVTLIFAGVGIVPITLLTVVLDGPTLAAILEGTITDWLAPQILALNPSGVLDPSGVPLNRSSPQPITLLSGPIATTHSLNVLMRSFLPTYTGIALLAAIDFSTEDVLRMAIFDFPLALSITAFTGNFPSGLQLVPLLHNGQVVAPSWLSIAACGSSDAFSTGTCSFSLHRSSQPGCYPLARTVYLSVKRPDCSDASSVQMKTCALMDWVISSTSLDVVLHTAYMTPLFHQLDAVQTCNARAMDVVSCIPRPLNYMSIVIGASAGAGTLLLLLLLFALLQRRRSVRDTSAAPKDSCKPFCIVFTDIENSTHLWATIPSEMAAALEIHHATTRATLRNFGLYEVKTLGDSFMCATKDPRSAVAFGLELQRKLFEAPWGSNSIDFAYLEKEWQLQDGPGLGAPRVHFALKDELSDCWRGLRVRIGVHQGPGQVSFDQVSKGYDYYGTVVNTAARICSVGHGGQLLVSQTVFEALGGFYLNSLWTDLGRHPLAGLPEPVHLWQVLPEGVLSHRTFLPLRLEKAKLVGEEMDLETPSSNVGGRSTISIASFHPESHPLVLNGSTTADDLQQAYTTVTVTIRMLLSTQTSKFRDTMLRGLCSRLKVPYRNNSSFSMQQVLHGLVLRVLPAVVASNGGRRGTNVTTLAEVDRAAKEDVPPAPIMPVHRRSPPFRTGSPANCVVASEVFPGIRRPGQLLHAFSASTAEELNEDLNGPPGPLPNVPLWQAKANPDV